MDQGTTSSPASEEEIVGCHLEPDQVCARLPVPRAVLTPRQRMALWVLRVAAIVVSAMVIYAFIADIR